MPKNAKATGPVRQMPIRVSDGEYVIHPGHVAAMGGPAMLDKLVANVRSASAAQNTNAPPPK
jgi:hypothetical protein